MTVFTRKLGTLGRVVRREGISGIASILAQKAEPVTRAVVDYARLTPSALASLTHHGRPDLLIHVVGAGIGDDLLCSAIFRELRRRGHDFWVSNRHPELYEHTGDAPVVVPPLSRYDVLLKKLGARVIYPYYTSYHPAYDRDDPMPEQHLISLLCQRAGITGEVALRPYLTLTESERARGRLVPRQVAIQSAGLDAKHAMRNKNWYPEGYQGVVSALRGQYNFVQVGSRNDPPLEGALDLRGKTSLRESAAVLAGSLTFVGQVGFLMHLARAVDCRAVIVYGGRETPAQSGYLCNDNLYSPVPCSPCWRLNSCPYDRMCLQMIGVADVTAAVERQVERHGTPLPCDTDTITPERIAFNSVRYEHAIVAHQVAWSVLNPDLAPSGAEHLRPRDVPQSPTPAATHTRAKRPRRVPRLAEVPGLHLPPEGLEDILHPADTLRLHGTLTGRGTVYDGEQMLVHADYVLEDVQELVHTRTPVESKAPRELERGGLGIVPGERSVYGLLKSPKTGMLSGLVGNRLTLRLEDERVLDFTVVQVQHPAAWVNASVQALLIQGLGGVR